MKRFLPLVLSVFLTTFCLQGQFDNYGGWTRVQGKKTGFFHIERIEKRFWLITPEGNAFFAKGVESVDTDTEAITTLPDQQKVLNELAIQLKSWNFNTAGSQKIRLPGMPYTVNLDLALASAPDVHFSGSVPDYFSPDFQKAVEKRASEICSELADDPWLIGYYTDNELPWATDSRSNESLLEKFLNRDPESPGHKRAVLFLQEREHTPETMTFEDMNDFLKVTASQYGRIVYSAIKRYDKNHLILGCRLNNQAPVQVAAALAPYFDVFSFNNYEHRAPLYKLREITRESGRPTMVTEFSFKAMDSGLFNTIGAGNAVANQRDRAELYAGYVNDLAGLSSCVGFYWYKYRDQPKEGTGVNNRDGRNKENNNYGLVKIDGSPWTILVEKMKQVNANIEEMALTNEKK